MPKIPGVNAFVTFSSSAVDIYFSLVVFPMSQHVTDVDLVSIIVHSSDQSNFVAVDIEDGVAESGGQRTEVSDRDQSSDQEHF